MVFFVVNVVSIIVGYGSIGNFVMLNIIGGMLIGVVVVM